MSKLALCSTALVLPLLILSACSADAPYDDEAIGETSAAVRALGPPNSWQDVVVPRASAWAYDATGRDLGTTWRTYHYGEWPEAAGPLGYGESYLATQLPYGNDPSHKPITTYFKRAFYARPGVTRLYLRVMYDDGFVFYLNGKEGGRAAMPSGAVTASTLALGHEASNQYVTFDISAQLPNLLANGTNTLAFEVHQASPSSSDLVFDAELVAWVGGDFDPGSPEGVPPGWYWTFWDRGGDLGSAWRMPGYDDSAWSMANGPLGFGESYIVGELAPGPITSYFRTHFQYVGSVEKILARVMYDDGFVAYLNGHEIARVGLPAGTIAASTLAAGHEAYDHYESFDWTAAAKPYVLAGENELAVEVHQGGTQSSDLVFDLALDVLNPWHRQPTALDDTVAWSGVDFLDTHHGFVVGSGGTLLETTDAGTSWVARTTGTTQSLLALRFADATHGWIVGAGGTILATSDAGATWASQAIPGVTLTFGALSMTSATSGWIVGNDEGGQGHVYRTTDGAAHFTLVDTPPGQFFAIAFADDLHGWVGGVRSLYDQNGNFIDSRGTIYATTDGGATWTEKFLSGVHNNFILGLTTLDASTVWAVGQSSLSGAGAILLGSHDGGTTWSSPATGVEMGLRAIRFVDPLTGWAAGDGGEIIHTEDGGVTWAVQQTASMYTRPWIADLDFVDRTHGWAAGALSGSGGPAGRILYTTTGGE